MRKIYLFTIIFSIFLYGCGRKYEIHPLELPNAYTGKSYSQTVTISGGKVIDKNFILKTNFPEDMGLKIQTVNDLDGYNVFKIEGIPKYKGNYIVTVYAEFFGGGNNEIKKTYKFTVE
ncbi:hypothetical protein [Acinetobacter larvae]|uniref:Uncharacterized protein n=1 Tax=Acinetobacter larvae TaxID=1789224 RepID=A0A1B2M1L0_9GAMM|nr:hypothetical protein [Acinetobacter larvae]AOA58903.1 hypothetical protein BFG52_11425 [Acinetobacter larvae]